MKKCFFSLAVFTAMFLMVGCGGNDIESSRGYGYSECSYGSYKCKGGDSYRCSYADGSNDLTWQLSERCSYSCDDYTGKCSSNSSDGNSGGGSSGGNGGGSGSTGSWDCSEIYDCYTNCSDSDCANGCLSNGSSYGQSEFMSMYNCWDQSGCFNASSNDEFSNCVYNYCYNETDTCIDLGGGSSGGNGGGSGSTGSWDCSEIYDCYAQCETDSCAQACYDNGSSYGQSQFMDMYNCWVQYCSNSSDFTNCVYSYCYNETDACINLNGGGSGGGGSTSECTSGQYMCSGSYSYYCSYGSWTSDQYCSNGCNSSTGKCKSSSGGGSTSECTSGDYKCSGSYSYYCSYGSWTSDQYCSNGCDSSTGKCKSSSGGGGSTTGNKPCIDDFNGAYTGTDSTYLELHWSLKQTGTCGKAEKVTLQVQVGSSYKTLTEKSAYLYDTYSFDAEPYFSSYPYQVYVSLKAKNSYGSTFWSIGCDYKENHFGDYDICYTILHY